jgi:DNA invertase Pin-like site-specific DNA recombinase
MSNSKPSSELVRPGHLARKAVIYVRQSSPHQVLTNQESLKLQYDLKKRATDLGWHAEDIEVVDADLGLTGSAVDHRQGFKDLVTRVTLGQVGLVLSSEVTRLSRNCSDWYPLLDVCGYKGTLIADADGVYDPATVNGRLILGLKGTLSEMELHTIRGRMNAGLLNKAERGELAQKLPTGLERDEHGLVHKDPNIEVQDRISLVFETFLRLRSASKVLRFFSGSELLLPRRDRFGDIAWKRPTLSAVTSILKNPAYAGAFVYGKTSHTTLHSPQGISTKSERLPMQQWRILIKDKYPAYVEWETFEKVQQMLKDNFAEYEHSRTRGVPRDGKALLHGLVYCGECGHKMVVQYKRTTRYICDYLHKKYQAPDCQNLPADPVDAVVVDAFFEALSPVELDLYSKAMADRERVDEQAQSARHQQLERLRYQAAMARRRFERVDPDNRLVAVELERRWEAALRELRRAEETEDDRHRESGAACEELSEELKAAFTAIGQKLPLVWDEDLLSQPNKKALLRCLIGKVVVHRLAPDLLRARIVWKGGQTTTFEIPVTVGAFTELSGAQEMERLILELFGEGSSDEEIAQRLTELGHRSPRSSDHVLSSTVMVIRYRHGLLRDRSQSHPRKIPGRLTVPQVARKLEVGNPWVYDRIHNGRIRIAKDAATGLYLFPDEPGTIGQLQELKEGKVREVRF